MNKTTTLAALLILALASSVGHANSSWIQCAHGHFHAALSQGAPTSPGFRKYAPDRSVDVTHLKLEITPDFDQRSIEGIATLEFSPIAYPLRTLTLNARDLAIQRIEATHEISDYENTDTLLKIHFSKEIPNGAEASVTIHYSAEPKSGLFFRTKDMGYPEDGESLFTQGEAEDHQHWFPSHDYPNEKFSTEVVCHAPEGMIALSNGRLVSETPSDSGRTTYHWLQKKPHVNYLVSLIVGRFAKEEDQLGDLPLAFYAPPEEKDQIANSFQDTKAILEFFEEEIGVPYPWAKYYNVCVYDFMFGGMENTSLTTLTTGTLFTDDYENLKSSRGLDAHEIAHQWFGDIVTCKDWSHAWLNEGFATYYSLLYDKHKLGEDEFKLGLLNNARGILSHKNDETPIVNRIYETPMEQFSFRAYPKGAWVLHMLRSQLGEDIYREAVKTYLDRHAYQSVESEALTSIFEEVSGRSLDQFFDQWIYLAGAPELDVSYSWDALGSRAKISVAQTQAISEKRPLFKFPLKIRFTVDGETVERAPTIEAQQTDLAFRLESRPTVVRIDPDVELLSAIRFTPPREMLEAQLAEEDAIGRLLAIREIAKKKDARALESLVGAMENDPFHGVSTEAARLIGDLGTDEAFAALRNHLRHPEAKTRRAIIQGLNKDYSRETLAALRNAVDQESNPGIKTAIIRALGKYEAPGLSDDLIRWLHESSYHDEIASAAIAAMKTQDTAIYTDALRAFLNQKGSGLRRRPLASAFDSLAFLARDLDEKAAIREDLLQYINDSRERVRIAAIRALGVLRDPRAKGPLVALSQQSDNPSISEAARDALNALGSEPEPRQAAAARRETLDLQDQLREMNQQLDKLRSKVESLEAAQQGN